LPNWTLIRALSAFLIGVVNNSNINKMSVRNVGIVFSPTLNIPAPIFGAFLTEFDAIFGTEAPEPRGDVVATEVMANSPSDDGIRSPRRQVLADNSTPSYNQATFPQHGLGLTYEQVLHESHRDGDAGGFNPLRLHDDSNAGPRLHPQQPRLASVTMPGPEYGAYQRVSMATNGLGTTGVMRDTKARRRESSMLLSMGPGQRKLSLPMLKGGSGPLG
jgi:RalA-binding protein 1